LKSVGTPLPRRAAVLLHRRRQIRTLLFHNPKSSLVVPSFMKKRQVFFACKWKILRKKIPISSD